MNHSIISLKKGKDAKISHFTDEAVACKLMSMGVLPGSSVRIVRTALFNGGYYLQVDGSNLVLRAEEASSIMLENTVQPQPALS